MTWTERTQLILTTLALAGCSAEASKSRPHNVVLICMDTVRADHVGAYGHSLHPTTPFLDELAERSTVFRDTSATAGWTKPSVPSFLTGTYPCQHGVYEGSAKLEQGAVTDVLPDEALTLAEVFREEGYSTAAFIRNSQLRPGNGFEQGFDVYRDEAGDARSIRWHGLDWLDGRAGEEEPFFLYLHFLDAHWPYPVPDEYATRFANGADVELFRSKDFKRVRDAVHDGEVEFSEEQRIAMEALYDGSIRYIDDQLALLARGLAARGLLEDTIFCVISDHGEEFGEHGRIGHGHGLWQGLLQVPWILHVPGQDPAQVTNPVSLVDLFPTLLSAARLPQTDTSQGVDRLRNSAAAPPVFAEHKAPDRYMSSLRAEDQKIIRHFIPPRSKAGEFPVKTATRWEAELARLPDGRFLATQLKPRDDDTSDPLEIKGPIEALTNGGFRIGSVAVHVSEATTLSLVDETQDEEIAVGRTVKVRGVLSSGRLEAGRLKLYSLDDRTPLEVRGTVTSIDVDEGIGSIVLDGFTVVIDKKTDFKNVSLKARRPRLERAGVLEFLTQGVEDVRESGIEVRESVYDLAADPDELQAVIGTQRLADALDALSRELLNVRLFEGSDRLLLTPEMIRKLRELGYAE